MNLLRFTITTALFAGFLFFHTTAFAASDEEMETLRKEIQEIKSEYENRISEMEKKLAEMETSPSGTEQPTYTKSKDEAFPGKSIYGRSFNPSIGAVLNGRFANFSSDEDEIPGFVLGHEASRGDEGMTLGETEFNFSSSVDDKFYASITSVLALDEGAIEVELEEAYVETLPGLGLPTGATVRMGTAFWTLGYLNEHHAHADDFADRPLPYRVFLNTNFNDTGAQISYLLPTDFYIEAGGGIYRGGDFPFAGGSGSDVDSFSAFLRIGSDIGQNSSWRIGGYILDGKANGRGGGGGHGDEEGAENGHGEEEEEEEGEESPEEFFTAGVYTGDTRLWVADLRYVWAPTGNPRQKELLFQAEYFRREETGVYLLTEEGETEERRLDGGSQGWYAQSVFKFSPAWRIGARYSRIYSPEDSELGHDPYALAFMGDWSNSEFSRIRLQYNYEKLAEDRSDNQILLQYIMSIGAHAAHKY